MSPTDPAVLLRLEAELDAAQSWEAQGEIIERMTQDQVLAFISKLRISLGMSVDREPSSIETTTATAESTVSIPNETAITFATDPSPKAEASDEATRAAKPSATAHPDPSEAAHTTSHVVEALSDVSVDRPVDNKALVNKIIERYGRIDTVDETRAIIEGIVGKDNTTLNPHHPLKLEDHTVTELLDLVDLQDRAYFKLLAEMEALRAEKEALLAKEKALLAEKEA